MLMELIEARRRDIGMTELELCRRAQLRGRAKYRRMLRSGVADSRMLERMLHALGFAGAKWLTIEQMITRHLEDLKAKQRGEYARYVRQTRQR